MWGHKISGLCSQLSYTPNGLLIIADDLGKCKHYFHFFKNMFRRPSVCEPHPVKRTEKKYKVFPASSRALLAVFYAARQSVCFSIGVSTPRLRWTRLVL